VVEEAADAGFTAPEGFEELERRAYDDTELVFLRYDVEGRHSGASRHSGEGPRSGEPGIRNDAS
jgi:hypothetical protein